MADSLACGHLLLAYGRIPLATYCSMMTLWYGRMAMRMRSLDGRRLRGVVYFFDAKGSEELTAFS